MSAFLALVRKDLILFLSDRRALVFSLLLPIVIAAFFGSVFGGSGKGSAIEVGLVMQDRGDAAGHIAAGLKSEPSLRVVDMDLAHAEQAVRRGDLKAAIVIPPGFAEAAGTAMFSAGEQPVIRLLHDPSQPAVLAMVKGMLTQQIMSTVSAEMFGGTMGPQVTERSLQRLDAKAAGGQDDRALRDMLTAVHTYQVQPAADKEGGAKRGLAMPFATHDEALSSAPQAEGYNPYAHAFAGMGVQFILFMGVDMGIGILLSQRSGVWNRLLAAPVSLPQLLLARAASAAIITVVLLCAIFGVAVAIFGVHVTSVPGFVALALCFGLLTAGFGLLVAAFGKTPEAARKIAMFATLILVMLSGAWMPSFMFPEWVQKATLAVPTRWAIDGLDAITWRGLDAGAAAPAMAVQLLFAVVFGLVALWKFGREQR